MGIDWMRVNDTAELRKFLNDGRIPESEREAIARKLTGIEKGDHMVAGSGLAPWHYPWLGTNATVVEGRISHEEALRKAKLDWAVDLVPSQYTFEDRVLTNPEGFQIIRLSDGKALGQVGKKYKPLQNERAFRIADALVGLGGDGIPEELRAHYETAGSLKGGKFVYLTLRTPFDVTLAGGDKLETFLLIFNRHDGNASVTVAIVTIRVECRNTLSRSIAGALGLYRVRHTASMEAKLLSAEARQILGLAQGAADKAEEVATKLAAQKMSNAKFNNFLDLLLKADLAEEPTPRMLAGFEKRRAAISDIYFNHPTQDSIRGTAWGAYNAVTAYHDHVVDRRDMGGDNDAADQRMLAVVSGGNLGDKAVDILMDGIGGGRWLSGRSK